MSSRGLWLIGTALTISFALWSKTQMVTLRTLPFFLLCCLCTLDKHFFSKYRYQIFWLLAISCAITFPVHGILETKSLIFFYVCLCGTNFLAEKFEFKPYYVILFVALEMFPLGVVNGGANYIPVAGQINILGGTNTKHGTGLAGLLILLPTLYYIYCKLKCRMREGAPTFCWPVLVGLFLASIYLIVFSTSRSETLGAAMTILFFGMNILGRFKVTVSKIFFWLAIVSVFLSEKVAGYTDVIEQNEEIAEFAHTDNFEQYGVTSGRSWLWEDHINSFLTSPLLLGGGREVVDFQVGDWIPRLKTFASAGSESPYTGYLACYGLIGVCMLLVIAKLFYRAANQRNTVAASIIFCMIYNSLMGVNMSTPTIYSGILLYLLFFTCMRDPLLVDYKRDSSKHIPTYAPSIPHRHS